MNPDDEARDGYRTARGRYNRGFKNHNQTEEDA